MQEANDIKDKEIKEGLKKAPTLATVMHFSREGTSYTNADGTRFNKHDKSRGVDVTIRDEYVKNGADNFLPFDISKTVIRSTIMRRAFRTICAVASGELRFIGADGMEVSEDRRKQILALYESIGITRRAFIKPAISSAYLYGACPVTFTWNSNGREFALSNVTKRDYKTMRLGKPMQVNGRTTYEKHYYHRNWGWRESGKNKKVQVSKRTKSWLQWERATKKNEDDVTWMYSYDMERTLGAPINRTQSYLIADMDELSDHYPLPSWFSATAMNYAEAEFLLSCFDLDDIKNGFHASGFVKVYHSSYKEPDSGEAVRTFEEHKKMVEERLRGSHNSGSVVVVPVGIDGEAVEDFMEFVPMESNNNRDRHDTLDSRTMKNLLSANSAIYSELFGIRDEKNALSEGDGKLIIGLKILNRFVIKPLKELFDDEKDGFLNMVNAMLGIEERTIIMPDLSAFLNIDGAAAMHYLHPEQWYAMYRDFGLMPSSEEQVQSGFIPAYRQGSSTSITVNNGN